MGLIQVIQTNLPNMETIHDIYNYCHIHNIKKLDNDLYLQHKQHRLFYSFVLLKFISNSDVDCNQGEKTHIFYQALNIIQLEKLKNMPREYIEEMDKFHKNYYNKEDIDAADHNKNGSRFLDISLKFLHEESRHTEFSTIDEVISNTDISFVEKAQLIFQKTEDNPLYDDGVYIGQSDLNYEDSVTEISNNQLLKDEEISFCHTSSLRKHSFKKSVDVIFTQKTVPLGIKTDIPNISSMLVLSNTSFANHIITDIFSNSLNNLFLNQQLPLKSSIVFSKKENIIKYDSIEKLISGVSFKNFSGIDGLLHTSALCSIPLQCYKLIKGAQLQRNRYQVKPGNKLVFYPKGISVTMNDYTLRRSGFEEDVIAEYAIRYKIIFRSSLDFTIGYGKNITGIDNKHIYNQLDIIRDNKWETLDVKNVFLASRYFIVNNIVNIKKYYVTEELFNNII